jgi:hypothetical protein
MRRDAEARDRELVRAYLADELAPEVRRATEERLAVDETLFDRYWQAVAAKRFGVSLPVAPRARRRWRRVALLTLAPLVALAGLGAAVTYVQTQWATNAEIASGRAVTTDLWFPVRYATGANPGYLNFGESAVRLAPDSRLTHGRAFVVQKGHGWVAIDGLARIETHEAAVIVRTSTAEFHLRANGRYIIDAPVGGAETTLDVRTGSAQVERPQWLKGDEWRPVAVLPGAKASVTKDGRFGVAMVAVESFGLHRAANRRARAGGFASSR